MKFTKFLENLQAFNHGFSADFKRIFFDLMNLQGFNRVFAVLHHSKKGSDFSFSTEFEFWRVARSGIMFEGAGVELTGFNLMEWLPLSPGLYFSDEARRQREVAERYLLRDIDEGLLSREEEIYLPRGKESMVLGGVGSLRLASATSLHDGKFYWLCASSSGQSHCGIPIAVDAKVYESIISDIKRMGAVRAAFGGRLALIPKQFDPFNFTKGVPRFCVIVERMRHLSHCETPLLVTVALTFSARDREDVDTKMWGFSSFDPSRGEAAVASAALWLQSYAIKHSRDKTPTIFADFDEVFNHFDCPVEFPLSDLLAGNVNLGRLRRYASGLEIRVYVEQLVLGDKFENISNSTIINRSDLTSFLGRLGGPSHDQPVLNLIKMAGAINRSANSEAAQLFLYLGAELCQIKPREAAIRAFWREIAALVPEITQLGDSYSVLLPSSSPSTPDFVPVEPEKIQLAP